MVNTRISRLNQIEAEFVDNFGLEIASLTKNFIVEHGFDAEYRQASNNFSNLLLFGMKYGLVEIVAYCYCVKQVPVDIPSLIQQYTGKVENPIIPDNCVTVDGQRSSNISLGANLWDRFSYQRQSCIQFLYRMIKFSHRFKNSNLYKIVPKYIEPYRLLTLRN